ncbi:MAG: 3-hydroxyacyl-CoA dehydrogenase NAD-binding domain-containing protein [Nitrosomonadales bacterium]
MVCEQGAGRFEKARPRNRCPAPARLAYIQAANYDEHLDLLRGCDLVIEAIAERMDWKSGLYQKVAPYLGEHSIFATNTSGLSINKLAAAFPENMRHRFCGIHFFNPPRYMHLVELDSLRRHRYITARSP